MRLTSSGKAEVLWVKDVFDGVFLDADRGDGKGYVFLDYDPRPNFTDNWLPPKATTVRVRYRAQYSYKGERFGQFGESDPFPLSGPE